MSDPTKPDRVCAEFEPCPFCGSDKLLRSFTQATETFAFWSVECRECGIEVADDESQEAADRRWNARAQPPAAPSTANEGEAMVAIIEAKLREIQRPDTARINAFEIAQAIAAMSPTPDAVTALREALSVEEIAQFLHDEGGFDDAWTQHTWPEHPSDTGQRDVGWVKIVPSDVQAKFRDVATRLKGWMVARAALSKGTEHV